MSRLPHLPLTPVLLFAATIAIGYLIFTTAHYAVHNYQQHHEADAIRADIARLDDDHRQLMAVRDYLKSDEYVEDIARRILGLVRPGETLVVVSSTDGSTGTPTAVAATTPGAGWWRQLFPRVLEPTESHP